MSEPLTLAEQINGLKIDIRELQEQIRQLNEEIGDETSMRQRERDRRGGR